MLNNMNSFIEELVLKVKKKKTILCIGLDPQISHLPDVLKEKSAEKFEDPIEAAGDCLYRFNKDIIDVTREYVVCYKIQSAFYEKYGTFGVRAFEKTINYIKESENLVIADVKRGDGGDTALAYADGYLGQVEGVRGEVREAPLKVDALTVNIQIGEACLIPFLEQVKQGKGIFVLLKTSFRPNSAIENIETKEGIPAWEKIAHMIYNWGDDLKIESGYNNLGVVVGATYPRETLKIREILPYSWFLVPGYGKQGGKATEAISGIDKNGLGVIVNSSRGIITAHLGQNLAEKKAYKDFIGKAAKNSRDELNKVILEK
jgi:orotidine-5'-phosphate decarboxylase